MSPTLPAFARDLKVLVLAGTDRVSRRRRPPEGGEREIPLRDKAFLELRGRLVIEYVLDWLAAAGLSRTWVLAAPEQLDRIPGRHRFERIEQPPVSSIFVNLSRAHAALAPAPDEPVLVVFGDHPLNTVAALRSFLTQCEAVIDDLDFAHAFSLRSAYAEYAPYFRRTAFHTREMSGRATGINLAVPSRLHRLPVLDEMYGVRKQERFGSFLLLLSRLVSWLGPRSPRALLDALVMQLAKEAEKRAGTEHRGGRIAARVEGWLRRRVPVSRLEGYARRVLQAERSVRLFPVAHGGIAIDVDFAEELRTLDAHWERIEAITSAQDARLTAPEARGAAR